MLIVDVARWQPWRRSGVYLVLLVAGDGCSLSKRCPAGTGDRQQWGLQRWASKGSQ